jgi:hypothetical protein
VQQNLAETVHCCEKNLRLVLGVVGKTRILCTGCASFLGNQNAAGRDYNPNFPAEFSLNKLPSRMYLRTICTLRWAVWFMIDRSDAPAIAALVAWPARSEWPAYFPGSRPARTASFLTTRGTSMPLSRVA